MLILLAILLTLSYVEKGNRSALVGASVCLGLTMLFKFHTGVIGIIGFAVFSA
jgi:hypothetical protein